MVNLKLFGKIEDEIGNKQYLQLVKILVLNLI